MVAQHVMVLRLMSDRSTILSGSRICTAQKYSNLVGRGRLRETATEQWPAPTTTYDLGARSLHHLNEVIGHGGGRI
jgi:hypothetical protein